VLGHADIPVVPDRLIITAGLQHAMTICIAALCEPGDLVLAESRTYPGIRALGIMHHLRLQGVAMDAQGLVPDAFEAACRGGSVRALYTIPTLQNPTATILPEDRRRKIADIARRFDVTIIEDDLYGFHLPDVPPRFAAIAPDITIYLTSVSKCLMPGLRVGFAVPPERLMSKLSAMVHSTLWMNAPPMIEVFRQLVASGDADRVVSARHAEAAARQDIAQRMLGDFVASPHRMSPHLWLPLPEHWQGNDFVSHARMRNVIVSTAEDFALTHEAGANHARLCLGCPPSRSALETALCTIGDLLSEGADLSWSFA
jgi:DNA-binding transcriptional MocR family regulator